MCGNAYTSPYREQHRHSLIIVIHICISCNERYRYTDWCICEDINNNDASPSRSQFTGRSFMESSIWRQKSRRIQQKVFQLLLVKCRSILACSYQRSHLLSFKCKYFNKQSLFTDRFINSINLTHFKWLQLNVSACANCLRCMSQIKSSIRLSCSSRLIKTPPYRVEFLQLERSISPKYTNGYLSGGRKSSFVASEFHLDLIAQLRDRIASVDLAAAE